MVQILLGGAAGDGIETTAGLLERSLKQSGLYVYGMRDFMSRVRGGHNFARVRFDSQPLQTHQQALDGLVVWDRGSYEQHQADLVATGFLLADPSLGLEDPRLLDLPLRELAKQAGNAKSLGSVAVGVIGKLYGLPLDSLEQALRRTLAPKLQEVNLRALQSGYHAVESRWQLAGTDLTQQLLLDGGQAMALGALAADLRFYAAYPMSPATSVMEYLAEQATRLPLVVEQAEDEIAAINMALGAAAVGARAMTASSGGGFALMVEALGLAAIAELPLVIADIQRPGPATGLATRTEQSDLRFVISASQGDFARLVIAIQDHQSAYQQTRRAFDLAEKYQMPVILLSDQYLADSTALVPLDALWPVDPPARHLAQAEQVELDAVGRYRRYRLTADGVSPRLLPGQSAQLVLVDSHVHDEYGLISESAAVTVAMAEKRQRKLAALRADLEEPRFCGSPGFDTLLVGFGSTYGALAEAVEILNQRLGGRFAALSFGDVYPLPTQRLQQYLPQARTLVNVEQNATGQLAALIRETMLRACDRSVLKYDGRQISAAEIVDALTDSPRKGA